PARAQSSPAPSFQTDGSLPLIVGSLCLAGIVGLLGALAAVRLRQRRPVWTPGPAPWRSADSTPLGLRPGRDPDTGKTDLRRETRDAPDLERELESTLQDLFNGGRPGGARGIDGAIAPSGGRSPERPFSRPASPASAGLFF